MSNNDQGSQSSGIPTDSLISQMSSELHHAAPAVSDVTVPSPYISTSSSELGAPVLPAQENAQLPVVPQQGAAATLTRLQEGNDRARDRERDRERPSRRVERRYIATPSVTTAWDTRFTSF